MKIFDFFYQNGKKNVSKGKIFDFLYFDKSSKRLKLYFILHLYSYQMENFCRLIVLEIE